MGVRPGSCPSPAQNATCAAFPGAPAPCVMRSLNLVGSRSWRAVVNHLEGDFHHAICRGRLGDLTTDHRPVAIDQETRDNPMHALACIGVRHLKLADDRGALRAALVKRGERKVPQANVINEDLPPPPTTDEATRPRLGRSSIRSEVSSRNDSARGPRSLRDRVGCGGVRSDPGWAAPCRREVLSALPRFPSPLRWWFNLIPSYLPRERGGPRRNRPSVVAASWAREVRNPLLPLAIVGQRRPRTVSPERRWDARGFTSLKVITVGCPAP